ncbi:hypothetical protein [Actinocorallia longicatena]|uniref:DMT family transporter n=1 Tax=Actinocorallia longicatena TaxID=111803 RepID=A0ABP6PWC5_9ACTN
MSAIGAALGLSLLSALGYAGAAVIQERIARTGRTAVRVLVSPIGMVTTCLNGFGALLHVVALKFGPLSLLQPMGVLTLVVAVPLGASLARRRVSARERLGVLWTMIGLAGLLLVVAQPVLVRSLNVEQVLLVSVATVLVLGILLHGPDRGGLRRAAASGIAFGVASAFTQTAAEHLGGPLSTAFLLPAALVVPLMISGLVLAQSAYTGGLGAPLAVQNLVNPAAAAIIGLFLLGEHFRGGPLGLSVGMIAAAGAARGVVLLTRRAAHDVPDDLQGDLPEDLPEDLPAAAGRAEVCLRA